MADKALEIISMGDPTDFGLAADILAVGDRIIEVAGRKADDQLDFHYHVSRSPSVTIKVERRDGAVEVVTLPTEAIDGLQIWFEAMDFRRCRCKWHRPLLAREKSVQPLRRNNWMSGC